tara:strand:+ start:3201 stop:3887 length:687 start_codon:yes stop_codon:yes gene_type:complete
MKNQKGFALVLALVLLVVMSLMGGALIVVSSGDHQINNNSDKYQQTFYVAETALLEGEKYLVQQHLGPWDLSTFKRNDRNITPENTKDFTKGIMDKKNYTKASHGSQKWYIETKNKCLNSFPAVNQTSLKVVAAESFNFGILIETAFSNKTKSDEDKKDIKNLKDFYYEYFVTEAGSASFSGAGASIKKGATDTSAQGTAYKIYGCGIYGKEDGIIVALESSIVLPRQ